MVGPSGLRIDGPSGERWELGLELLERGQDGVVIGSVAVARHFGWPGADGRVHVVIRSSFQAEDLTQAAAEQEVAEGRATVSTLVADDRFRDLLHRHGVVWEYVADYGIGTTKLADLDDEGALLWTPGEPST